MIRAGRLNRRVTIQRRDSGEDSAGQPVDTWSDIATRWAAIQDLNGREYFAASGEQSEVSTKIRLRYEPLFSDVTPEDRATWNGNIYNIKSVINPNAENRELILMCERKNG